MGKIIGIKLAKLFERLKWRLVSERFDVLQGTLISQTSVRVHGGYFAPANPRDPLLIISTTVQSGTKSFLPVPTRGSLVSSPLLRAGRVYPYEQRVHTYTRNDLRALDSVPIPPYNSETGDKSDSPGSFLLPLSFSPSLSFAVRRARK